MTKSARWPGIWAWSLLLVCALGCGGGEAAYPVSGAVKYPDGSPLTGGTILFDNGQTITIGEIREDGTFQLADGAQPGTYTIFFGGAAAGEDYQKPMVARKFTSPIHTDLKRQVKAEENVFNDIVVEKPR